MLVAGVTPHHKFHLLLGIRRYTSNTTRYISNAIGGELNRAGPTETTSALSYRVTSQTRVVGGIAPTKNSICSLVLVGAFRTRPRAFQTRPGTFRRRSTGCLTGLGQETRFPPFHTEVRCRSVLAGAPQKEQLSAAGSVGTFQTPGREEWRALF